MRDVLKRQNAFATLLLAISILSVAPTLAHAVQQNATYPITINATGQATAVGTGPSGATTLNLTATAYKDANKWLILQNIRGAITIGSTSYSITGGQGSVTQFGDVAIFANTDSGKAQLVLHGTLSGNDLSFTPPSELVPMAYLSLNGTMTQGTGQSTTPSISAITNSEGNATVANQTNRTQGSNSTMVSTSPSSHPQNTTKTNSNVTSTANSTLSAQTVANNVTQSSTLSANAAIVKTSGNVTVTVTQYLGETTSTTRTVANITISYTVTTTVANTTITGGNVTKTITATTGT